MTAVIPGTVTFAGTAGGAATPARPASDTGTTSSDTLLVIRNRVRTVTDTGTTITSSVAVATASLRVDANAVIASTTIPAFQINGTKTHTGTAAEGLLLNTRLVQAIFDDQNGATVTNWKYPDGSAYDANRQTNEFIAQLATYKSKGNDAVTVSLQGGRPVITSPDPQAWDNTPWNTNGSIPTTGQRAAYWTRLNSVLAAMDSAGLICMLQLFYFGQVNRLTNDTARNAAMDNTVDWLLARPYRGVIWSLANEVYFGGTAGNTTWAGTMFDNDAATNAALDRVRARLVAGGWANPLVGITFGSHNTDFCSNSQLLHCDWVGLQDNSWGPSNHSVTIRATAIRGLANYSTHKIPILVVEDNTIETTTPPSAGVAAHDEAVTNHVSTGMYDKGNMSASFGGGDYVSGWQTVPTTWGFLDGQGGVTGSADPVKLAWTNWLAQYGGQLLVSRSAADTGAAITDTIARTQTRAVTDTGVTAASSSAPSVRASRTLTDTGTTITSSVSLGGVISRSVASTGATITSSVLATSSSHTFPRSASDTFTFTDAVKRLVHPFGPTDRGLALTDSALRGQQLQPGVTQSTPGIYEIGLSFVDAGIDTVELTPLVDETQGRIRIFIQAPSSAATVTVTRTHPSNTSVNVRGMTNAPISSNIFLGYDYEAPIGRELRYQATAYDAGGLVVSESDVETVFWQSNDTWLKDPLNPSRNIRVLMADPGEESFDAPTGLNTVLGRPTPIVVTEVRQAATGTLNILTLTDSDSGTLHLLTSTGNILLVQTSPAYGLGNLYFALQKIAAGRVTPLGFFPERSWALQYVETDAPVGVATGGDTTWQLVLVGYATWNALLNTESSWLDLLENINTLTGPQSAPTLAWRGA